MRVNHRIRVPEIRVVREDEQLGVMDTREALALAQEANLDLVEISPNSRPPVCRIMDYGRYKYDEKKKKAAAKRKQTVLELKEIKFRPKTDQHDLDFKTRHVRRFLEEGNKVRLVIVFRGREITHPETGIAVLEKVFEEVKDIGTVETRPNMEGRRMVMILGPLGGVIRRQSNQTIMGPSRSSAPSTSAPRTSAPRTSAPRTSAPSTSAPSTAKPDTPRDSG